MDRAARQIPVFRSANMSVGVALLKHLCREAAKVLGESFDVEIMEAHHNRKVDAPSGTALLLYDAIKDAYAEPRQAQLGRGGRDCKRRHQRNRHSCPAGRHRHRGARGLLLWTGGTHPPVPQRPRTVTYSPPAR